MSAYLYLMAWREIFAQALADLKAEENVSPLWLVNPGTGRRLKLDLYYPEVGLAVRFRGLRRKGQRRTSDWELLEEEQREEIRRELCRLNGVTLVVVDLLDEEPRRSLDRIHTALSAASRRAAHASLPHERKVATLETLGTARQRLMSIRERLRSPEDLALFAEKWRDRETAAVREAQRSTRSAVPTAKRKRRRYVAGMRVTHARFGEGLIVAVRPEGDDAQVTVDFHQAGQRTFLASLVSDKLLPVRSDA